MGKWKKATGVGRVGWGDEKRFRRTAMGPPAFLGAEGPKRGLGRAAADRA